MTVEFPRRAAGILIPLFSLRSPHDLGRGDFSGLPAFADLALAMGHRVIQLLPIDETPPGEASPYSAMSLMAIDPLYIAIAGLPGGPIELGIATREAGITIDLIRLRQEKEGLLAESFQHFQTKGNDTERAAVARFAEEHRDWLDSYALFRALKEQFRWAEWSKWPHQLARHEEGAVVKAQHELADRIATLKYFQYVAHRQWIKTRTQLLTRGVFVGGDLAFSGARQSAEVWANQEMYDPDRAVGAPPDAFSAEGQRWDLPMPDWQRMRQSGFRLLRARIRHARELYDLLRVDHVVGLFRTYGYPLGAKTGGAFDPPEEPAQIAQGREILRIMLEEAGPMRIIAEDLGVIPQFVREVMAELGIPGYKIPRWERDSSVEPESFADPMRYPRISLLTTGTHDTDTLVEWWETITPNERAAFFSALHIGGEASAVRPQLNEFTLDLILRATYASPSELAITPIQDLFGWRDRINLPGTVGDSNWRWRLPFDPAEALHDPKSQRRLNSIRAIALRTQRFTP